MNESRRTGAFLPHLLLILLPLLASGCSRRLISPPARTAELETPLALPDGEAAWEVAGGAAAGIFYVGVGSADLRVRKGLGGGLEGHLGVTGMAIAGSGRILATDYHPFIGALHGGWKWNPPGTARWLGLLGGFGLGYSTAGLFASPEAGLVLGFENRYLVPYLGARANLSLPFLTRSLDLGEPADSDDEAGDPPGRFAEEADPTFGGKGFGGLKLHLKGWDWGRRLPSLVAETTVAIFSQPWDRGNDPEGFIGIYAGLEMPIGSLR